MLKQTARFACLALLMFAASAPPQTAEASPSQIDGPGPYPAPPPTSCAPAPLPCQLGVAK